MRKLIKLCEKEFPNDMVKITVNCHAGQKLVNLQLSSSDGILYSSTSFKEIRREICSTK